MFYRKRQLLKVGGTNVAATMKAVHKRLILEAIDQWKAKLNKPTLSGKRVREAIMPHIYAWMYRTHDDLTYKMSQIIAGRLRLFLGIFL